MYFLISVTYHQWLSFLQQLLFFSEDAYEAALSATLIQNPESVVLCSQRERRLGGSEMEDVGLASLIASATHGNPPRHSL